MFNNQAVIDVIESISTSIKLANKNVDTAMDRLKKNLTDAERDTILTTSVPCDNEEELVPMETGNENDGSTTVSIGAMKRKTLPLVRYVQLWDPKRAKWSNAGQTETEQMLPVESRDENEREKQPVECNSGNNDENDGGGIDDKENCSGNNDNDDDCGEERVEDNHVVENCCGGHNDAGVDERTEIDNGDEGCAESNDCHVVKPDYRLSRVRPSARDFWRGRVAEEEQMLRTLYWPYPHNASFFAELERYSEQKTEENTFRSEYMLFRILRRESRSMALLVNTDGGSMSRKDVLEREHQRPSAFRNVKNSTLFPNRRVDRTETQYVPSKEKYAYDVVAQLISDAKHDMHNERSCPSKSEHLSENICEILTKVNNSCYRPYFYDNHVFLKIDLKWSCYDMHRYVWDFIHLRDMISIVIPVLLKCPILYENCEMFCHDWLEPGAFSRKREPYRDLTANWAAQSFVIIFTKAFSRVDELKELEEKHIMMLRGTFVYLMGRGAAAMAVPFSHFADARCVREETRKLAHSISIVLPEDAVDYDHYHDENIRLNAHECRSISNVTALKLMNFMRGLGLYPLYNPYANETSCRIGESEHRHLELTNAQRIVLNPRNVVDDTIERGIDLGKLSLNGFRLRERDTRPMYTCTAATKIAVFGVFHLDFMYTDAAFQTRKKQNGDIRRATL